MATDLSDLLKEGVVLDPIAADSCKQVIGALSSAIAAKLGLDPRDVQDAVIERENLGSTGVGEGVAIPHARVSGLEAPIGAFVRLTNGVDFDSPDGRPCDLIFMLLAPHSSGADHLRALAQVSRAFRNEAIRNGIRKAEDVAQIRAILCPASVSANAA